MSKNDVKAEIRAGTKKLKGDVRKAEGMFNGLGKSIAKMGVAFAAAFSIRSITRFTSESIKLYDIQAKAEQNLLVALKGRRGAQQDLINQAKELQKITLFGDEETIKAQALIAAFVKEKEQIKTIIPLVQDLAQAKGMQLSVAADLVSKTLGSTTNALSRYGITVEGAVGSNQRLQSLVTGLSNAFAGQAQAAAEAGTGGLTQLGNVYGDLREEIGALIVDNKAFKSGVDDITESVSKATRVITALRLAWNDKGWENGLETQRKFTLGFKEWVALLSPMLAITGKYSKEIFKLTDKYLTKWVDETIEANKANEDLNNAVNETVELINDLSKKPIPPIFNLSMDNDVGLDQDILDLNDALNETENEIESLFSEFSGMGEIIDPIIEKISLLQETTMSWGDTVMRAGVNGSESLKDYGRTVLKITKQSIAGFLAESVAATVSKALAGAPFPLNLALAPAAGGAAAALFNAALPSFAEGGIAIGPQLAMVGDNPGGKEAIIPLDKYNPFGGGKVQVEVSGRLEGGDIYFAGKRYGELLEQTT